MVNNNLFFKEEIIDDIYISNEINSLNKNKKNLLGTINELRNQMMNAKTETEILNINLRISNITDYIMINNQLIKLLYNKLYEDERGSNNFYFKGKTLIPTLNNFKSMYNKINNIKKLIIYDYNKLLNELNEYYNQKKYFMDVDLYEYKLQQLKRFNNNRIIKDAEIKFLDYFINYFYKDNY